VTPGLRRRSREAAARIGRTGMAAKENLKQGGRLPTEKLEDGLKKGFHWLGMALLSFQPCEDNIDRVKT